MKTSMFGGFAMLAVLIVCGGCGSGASPTGPSGGVAEGLYRVVGQGLWDSFEFRPAQQVVVQAMGQTKTGEYVVMQDGLIKVMVSGDVLTLKNVGDGCLVPTTANAEEERALAQWGETSEALAQLGRYCPASGRGSASPSGSLSSRGAAAGAPRGRYRASFGNEGIGLNFLDDSQVEVSMIEGGYEETELTSYKLAGDRILIHVLQGPSLTLDRRGNNLEASMDGITLRFDRQ